MLGFTAPLHQGFLASARPAPPAMATHLSFLLSFYRPLMRRPKPLRTKTALYPDVSSSILRLGGLEGVPVIRFCTLLLHHSSQESSRILFQCVCAHHVPV